MTTNETQEQLLKRQEKEYRARAADCLATFTSAHGRRMLKDMRKQYCSYLDIKGLNQVEVGEIIGKRNVVKDIEALLMTAKNPQKIEDLFKMPEDDEFEL